MTLAILLLNSFILLVLILLVVFQYKNTNKIVRAVNRVSDYIYELYNKQYENVPLPPQEPSVSLPSKRVEPYIPSEDMDTILYGKRVDIFDDEKPLE